MSTLASLKSHTNSLRSGANPKPSPAELAMAEYEKIAGLPSVPLSKDTARSPPPLLILDLNGSLLFRPEWVEGRGRGNPVPRPHLAEFCDYIFGTHLIDSKEYSNWEVMVWSSAQTRNVQKMCESLKFYQRLGPVRYRTAANSRGRFQACDLTDRLAGMSLQSVPSESAEKQPVDRAVVEIWTRERMNLSAHDYNQKVQTTKDLAKVWESLTWFDPYTRARSQWGPENTVIIDDSPDKMSLQPHNLCVIKEYVGDDKDDELLKMIDTLKRLRTQSNFVSFLKSGGLDQSSEKTADPSKPAVDNEGSGKPAVINAAKEHVQGEVIDSAS